MITTILKRDGEQVPFEKGKITIAMRKAFSAQEEKIDGEHLEMLTEEVVVRLEEAHNGTDEVTVDVEIIQNHVELILMEAGHFTTAKGYSNIPNKENHAI